MKINRKEADTGGRVVSAKPRDKKPKFVLKPRFNIDTLDPFTRGYIECALWASNDESTPSGGEPMDANYMIWDIADETIQKMIVDCKEFQDKNAVDLAKYCETLERSDNSKVANHEDPLSWAGHDFWLTRNHHCAGFWDRDGISDELGERLTEACRECHEWYLYVGDDKKIHGERG